MSSLIDTSSLISIINQAIENHKALSVIRKGDGENIFIGYGVIPIIPWKKYRKKLKHYNISIWNIPFQLLLRSDLIKALNSCDILGIAPLKHRHGFWSLEEDIQSYVIQFKEPIFCDMNFHLELIRCPYSNKLMNKDWEKVFSGKRIGLISHRDPKKFIKNMNAELKYRIDIPKRKAPFKYMNKKKYDHINKQIEKYNSNIDIWLLAAGVYSLIFSEKIRSLGGIAIDIGSSVDTWVNDYSTRGVHRKLIEGK